MRRETKRADEPPLTVGVALPPQVFPATLPAYVLTLHNLNDQIVIQHLPVIAWSSLTRTVSPQGDWYTGLYPITPGQSGIPMQHTNPSCHIDWVILHGSLYPEAVLESCRELVHEALVQLCYNASAEGVHYVLADDELEDTTPSAVLDGAGEWRAEDIVQAEVYAVVTRLLLKLIGESDDWTIDTVPLAPMLRAELIL